MNINKHTVKLKDLWQFNPALLIAEPMVAIRTRIPKLKNFFINET
ncbi:hypothetical protein P700755_001779 [Psychroflexus torquis ATCC 700755]|uniref:Uncharacterized protein n=1 Tax=Psychroflexus torquis (strain ATCC 700755 / CIP 106069 / ACAM 623) TaxID=313595 RepID=K4IT21_PSYTT|nr:hypothetical protein P700755_001779 [Psychroflexus torquis ATCC 700755]